MKIERFNNYIKENITEGPERANLKNVTSERPNVMPAPQGKIKENIPGNKMSYSDAFEQFIKGKIVLSEYSVPPYGDNKLEYMERFYGDGIVVEGYYKMISYGGGCSGEDCNSSFIISPDNKLISRKDW